MFLVHPPSCIHYLEYPDRPPPRLSNSCTAIHGASEGGTSSLTQFAMLCCAQATSEALGVVLMLETDEADRVRRVQVHVHDHGASPLARLGQGSNVSTRAFREVVGRSQ